MQASHICDHPQPSSRDCRCKSPRTLTGSIRQLAGLFVSCTRRSGVTCSHRREAEPVGRLSMAVLDALFRMISEQYDLVIIDLPPAWFD
jgi:Mrp family chromosome partitioning ATPase